MNANWVFLIALAIVVSAIIALLFIYQSILHEARKSSMVKCPKDYCEAKVWGSGPCPFWTNKTGRYYEQKCYHYPKEASSKKACEANKVVFYKICGLKAS